MFLASSASAAEDNATQVVERFQAGMLGVMKQAESLSIKGRYDRLLPVVERTFHPAAMVMIVTGRYWRIASAEQRRRLVAAFERMSVSTLATFVDGYHGEVFETVRERPASRRTTMVDTRIVRPGRDPVNISFVVGNYDGRWRIVDVIVAGGISELTVRRSEYSRILQRDGIEGLIAALDRKAAKILAGEDKAAHGPVRAKSLGDAR